MTAIHVNAHALARYAALCQQAQIVPIVEPEVLMDGDHDIDRCYDVTQRVLNKSVPGIADPARRARRHDPETQHGDLGQEMPKQAPVEEVAEKTVRMLRHCVPAAVPGIAFLSGRAIATKKPPPISTP